MSVSKCGGLCGWQWCSPFGGTETTSYSTMAPETLNPGLMIAYRRLGSGVMGK